MTQKISEVLKAARELITDTKHWTQGWFARTIQGGQVGPEHKFAVCFCSFGALYKVQPGEWTKQSKSVPAHEFINRFCVDTHHVGLVHFNDNHTHAEVLELFDKAIEEAIKHE